MDRVQILSLGGKGAQGWLQANPSIPCISMTLEESQWLYGSNQLDFLILFSGAYRLYTSGQVCNTIGLHLASLCVNQVERPFQFTMHSIWNAIIAQVLFEAPFPSKMGVYFLWIYWDLQSDMDMQISPCYKTDSAILQMWSSPIHYDKTCSPLFQQRQAMDFHEWPKQKGIITRLVVLQTIVFCWLLRSLATCTIILMYSFERRLEQFTLVTIPQVCLTRYQPSPHTFVNGFE